MLIHIISIFQFFSFFFAIIPLTKKSHLSLKYETIALQYLHLYFIYIHGTKERQEETCRYVIRSSLKNLILELIPAYKKVSFRLSHFGFNFGGFRSRVWIRFGFGIRIRLVNIFSILCTFIFTSMQIA